MKFPAGDFFMGIVFGIALPLIDMVNDGYLFYNTLHFKGDSPAMAGCRSCYSYGVAQSYEDRVAQSKCNVCASGVLNDGGTICGAYPSALDKMTELLNEKSCLQNRTVWRLHTFHENLNIYIGFC